MNRKHLEAAMAGIIASHLGQIANVFAGNIPDSERDLLVCDMAAAMMRNGAMTALGNLAESFALGSDNQIGVRAQIVAYQVPADDEKPIVIKLEAHNNALTGVQLAMLSGANVDIIGCQGELFAAHDLGIHIAPQMEFDDVA